MKNPCATTKTWCNQINKNNKYFTVKSKSRPYSSLDDHLLIPQRFAKCFLKKGGFPTGSVVKKPPAMQEMWVQSLGQEDPLEKGIAIHSSILVWRIPWTEEPDRL